jgi:hypothetical protein
MDPRASLAGLRRQRRDARAASGTVRRMKHLVAVVAVITMLGCGGSAKAPVETPAPAAAASEPQPATCCCVFSEGDRTGRHEMDLDDMEVREHLATAECERFGLCVADSVCDEEPEEPDPSMQP